jgi:hypothetical protein
MSIKIKEQDLKFIESNGYSNSWTISSPTIDNPNNCKFIQLSDLTNEIRRQRQLIQELVDKVLTREGL